MGFGSWFGRRRKSDGDPAPPSPSSPSPTRRLSIGGGSASINLPSDLQVETDDEGTVLAFVAGDDAITLRFTVLTFASKDGKLTPGSGADYVRRRAAEGKGELIAIGDRSVWTYEDLAQEGDEPLRIRYWTIGGDNAVAIFSATIARRLE